MSPALVRSRAQLSYWVCVDPLRHCAVIAASILTNESRELATQVQAVKNQIEKLII